MKYELFLDLFEGIDKDASYYEFTSVGRLYLNLTKKERPARWRRLLKQTEKLPNMQLWWELHEKHEESLLKHTQFETDEEIEGLIMVDNSFKSGKKKKKDSKKKKSAAASDTEKPSEKES